MPTSTVELYIPEDLDMRDFMLISMLFSCVAWGKMANLGGGIQISNMPGARCSRSHVTDASVTMQILLSGWALCS